MATVAALITAFENDVTITVRSRNGKDYWLHADQLPAIADGDLVYGVPHKKALRATNDVVWFDPKNMEITK